jgi:pimeloyl-ACP methyl ester carboxylesterase
MVGGAVAVTGLATSTLQHAVSGRAPHNVITLSAGAHRLRAVRAGSGPAVLLLHGYGESLLSWRSTLDRLAREADVLAIDLPGFGLSSKPALGYSTVDYARAVVAALDDAGMERAVVVGHSLGGAVALAAAVLYPDRVAGLVLLAPAVAIPWFLDATSAQADSRVAVRRAVARYERLRLRFGGVHDPAWLAESDTALAYDPADDPAYGVALEAVLREFDFAYLSPELAGRVRAPALVLWGEYDPIIPRSVGVALATALPGAGFEALSRSWHRPHVERPEEVAERIARFLRETVRPAATSP